MIRILLADDHNVMRDGLRLLLERESDIQVVGEAADGRAAIAAAGECSPDVVVMDITMPMLNGVEATRRIVEEVKGVGIVILSMHNDESYVLRCLRAGAKGYLLKDSAQGELIRAVRCVAGGRTFFSPKVSRYLQQDYVRNASARQAEDPYERLSNREREILQLVGEGRTNKEVANLLNLSVYTVETHRGHILSKLGLHSVPELILYAVRKGIVS